MQSDLLCSTDFKTKIKHSITLGQLAYENNSQFCFKQDFALYQDQSEGVSESLVIVVYSCLLPGVNTSGTDVDYKKAYFTQRLNRSCHSHKTCAF